MALLETVGLGHEYGGQTVLKNINLKISRGEVLALIGPTGAGKTTLLRLLDLLEVPSTGKIYFDGRDMTSSEQSRLEIRRRMSFVQQKPIVFSMSIYDNVACGLRWRQRRVSAVHRKVAAALELVNLAEHGARNAKTLSGGETQRVAIARALVTEPEVLFLDEPTANLDPASISKVEGILAQIIQEQKTAVVIATHDLSQGQRLAHRVGVLIGGEILQVGSPAEIFRSPRTKTVAEFVGVENILSGTIRSKEDNLATIEVDGQFIEAVSDFAVAEKVNVLIRPEDITFTLAKETTSARNVFVAEITRVTPLGELVRIEADCGFVLLGVITRRSVDELQLSPGKKCYASFKATAVHVIKRWN